MKYLQLLVLFVSVCYSTQETVKVSIYYESLCPDCWRFFINQFNAAYRKIGSSLEVDLLPYGKATQKNTNGVWTFQCQHGPQECYGNKAQACVLYENPLPTTVNYVGCIMGKSNPSSDTYLKQCADSTGVSWTKLQDCLKTTKGDKYLAELGERTLKVKPKNVPQLWFNNKYDVTLDLKGISNFLPTVCSLFKQKPVGC